jgi:L-amino acid N-acyltransferase YncA
MRAVQAIYAHYVLHGVATFETEPPSVDEMLARRAAVLRQNLPYLVAEVDGAGRDQSVSRRQPSGPSASIGRKRTL